MSIEGDRYSKSETMDLLKTSELPCIQNVESDISWAEDFLWMEFETIAALPQVNIPVMYNVIQATEIRILPLRGVGVTPPYFKPSENQAQYSPPANAR